MREMSLRRRFLAAVAGVSVIALVLTGLILSELFRHEIERQVDAGLSAHIDRLALLLELRDGKPVLSRPLLEPRFSVPYSGLYWQVDGPDGPVRRSRSLWDGALDLSGPPIEPGGRRQRAIAGPDGAPILTIEESLLLDGAAVPWRISVAIAASEIEAPVGRFQWLLGWSFGGLILALLGGATAAVWIGIRPLDRLRARLNQVHDREISRLEGAFPSELRPLIDDLNGLLDDREQAIQRARTQAGNLAHALKTPLSVIANEASAVERAGEVDRARILLDAVGAMERNIHHQLARSRAAAAARDVGQSVALAPVVERLALAMPVLHRERPIACHWTIPETARVRIDAEDLTEILGNLMDNAFTWATSVVRVSGQDGAGGTYVMFIDDDGPGLSPEQAERVLMRGERLDESRPGTGLGLSIVTELVEMFGGAFEIDRSDLGGMRATVRLMAA